MDSRPHWIYWILGLSLERPALPWATGTRTTSAGSSSLEITHIFIYIYSSTEAVRVRSVIPPKSFQNRADPRWPRALLSFSWDPSVFVFVSLSLSLIFSSLLRPPLLALLFDCFVIPLIVVNWINPNTTLQMPFIQSIRPACPPSRVPASRILAILTTGWNQSPSFPAFLLFKNGRDLRGSGRPRRLECGNRLRDDIQRYLPLGHYKGKQGPAPDTVIPVRPVLNRHPTLFGKTVRK